MYIYVYISIIYIIKGKAMKLYLGTQSFTKKYVYNLQPNYIQCFNVKYRTFRYLYVSVMAGLWIFDARVCNMCLFWWRHFNIISDFLLNKLFSLSSNIFTFSFKQREHLFNWGLYTLIWFFTAHVTFWVRVSWF